MREQLEALIAAEAEDRAKGRAWTAEMWRARLGVSLDPLNEFHIGDTVRVRESTGYLMPYVFRCGTVVSGSGYVTVTSPVVPDLMHGPTRRPVPMASRMPRTVPRPGNPFPDR